MLKRLASMIIGVVILAIIMIINNDLVFNIAVSIVSIIGLYEFYSAIRKVGIRPVEWIGYLSSLFLIGIPYISMNTLRLILTMFLPIVLLILFIISLLSHNKRNIVDISTTVFGIIYVTYMLAFIILTRQMQQGVYYVWYILGAAWITDTFAYLVGISFDKTIGNHKFSKISPNKSIEGCIGGIIGCAVFFAVYTYYLSTIGIELNLYLMAIIGVVASIISQIGDFSESAIKRYCKIKDTGNIMPGHGGILDRFDSILLVAPFIYFVFSII